MTLRSTLAVASLFLATTQADAQQRFTTQVMIVPAFSAPDRGPDRGAGGKVADIVRSRVSGAFPRQELRVISGSDIDDWLRKSGFEENAVLMEGELKELAKKFRADERITGTVTRASGRVHIDATLTPVRDLRMAQPLAAEGATVNDAGEVLAREAIAARRQLEPLRLCENLGRDGRSAEAVAAAAAGIAAYPRAIPARICLLNSLSRMEDVKADSIIAVARGSSRSARRIGRARGPRPVARCRRQAG